MKKAEYSGSESKKRRERQTPAAIGINPIPNASPNEGHLHHPGLAARLEVVWDPDDATGHRWPDPDDLEARRTSLLVFTKDVGLASGRHAVVTL